MFKYLKQYRFYITLFLFILIPLVSIDTSTRSSRDYRFYDRGVVYLTSPIQTAISWSLEILVSFFHDYIYLWNSQKHNQIIMEENRRLLNTIVNLRETEQENIRLRKLLHFNENFDVSATVARVIAKDVSTEFRMIRINRGRSSGIEKDMAVLNSEGVVGRVLRTTENTADVVTILDLLSAVDVIVKRSRARGIVEGMTNEIARLKFALRTDDIQPGDLLISSGLGGIFPKGIPLGTVSRVTRLPYGITQSVEVRPSVDFSRLEEVLVITESATSPTHLTTRAELGGKKAK
jgi:rod shape-determining protein MreC